MNNSFIKQLKFRETHRGSLLPNAYFWKDLDNNAFIDAAQKFAAWVQNIESITPSTTFNLKVTPTKGHAVILYVLLVFNKAHDWVVTPTSIENIRTNKHECLSPKVRTINIRDKGKGLHITLNDIQIREIYNVRNLQHFNQRNTKIVKNTIRTT